MRLQTYMCSLHSDIHSEYIISLEALRRLFIQRDENALLSKLFDITEGPRLVLRLGALAFHRLGQLLPEQLKVSLAARNTFSYRIFVL